MTTIVRIVLLSALLGLFSAPLFADGLPPSEESVCDVLNVDGATPGLFGLCNAYCEAKDCDGYPEGEQPQSCNRLLANYEHRADASELPMPCLADPEPVCPCWPPETDRLSDAGMGLTPDVCVIDGPNEPVFFDVAVYGTPAEVDMVEFFAESGECRYFNSLSGDDLTEATDEGEDAACRSDIHDLQDRDFGDVACGQVP